MAWNWIQLTPTLKSAEITKELNGRFSRLANLLQGFRRGGAAYILEYGLQLPVRTVEADAEVLTSDYLIRVDASGAAVTLALPPASEHTGKLLVMKKVDASANAVMIEADGAELIDGAASQAIAGQYDVLRLVSSGEGWDLT